MSTFGDRLREERKRLGLSQTEFAKAAGVHLNTQSRYEKGEREPDTAYLSALAGIGVDVGYIVGYTMPTPEEKLQESLFWIKAGETGRNAQDIFGNEIPGQREHYGEGCGWLLLRALELSEAAWNEIADKLVQLDADGLPAIDGNDPAWGQEVAKASPLISRLVEEASSLDSALLASVLENVEEMLRAAKLVIEPARKAQAVAMLYRAFRASGRVDPEIIAEAVKLASS